MAKHVTSQDEHRKETGDMDRSRFLEESKVRRMVTGAERVHFEGLGMAWTAVTGLPPKAVIPQAVATVMREGGTRPSWQWREEDRDYVLLAWPSDQPLRASVLLGGEAEGELKPVNACPLVEGVPNELTVAGVHPWEHGGGCTVAVSMQEDQNPMWFYDPFYVRDKKDLTEGVTQTFLLGALAFGVRRALLDEITVTQGPQYELHAQAWLEEHPDSSRIDVPPLKVQVAGRQLIYPGATYSEYQVRCRIEEMEDYRLDRMPIRVLYTSFPFENRPPLRLPIYVAQVNLGSYEPRIGHEIDAYIWLQGRITDAEEPPSPSE